MGLRSGGSHGVGRCDERTAYYGSVEALHALDLETGDPLWSFRTRSMTAFFPTPALHGTLVLAGSMDGALYAVEVSTGEERWRFQTASYIEHAVRVVDDLLLLRSRDGHIYALDAETGSERWHFDTRTPWGSNPTAGPGVVLFASDDGFLTALE